MTTANHNYLWFPPLQTLINGYATDTANDVASCLEMDMG